ncbi:MAG: hypothetical protein KDD22_08685, partial [Bdellovibrionales bacterium]|nr:hypothetical protein [Bdellovibrionales bacterium]
MHVFFNGNVEWNKVSQSYIEYIPFNSKDSKPVRSYPEPVGTEDQSLLNNIINWVAQYVPQAAQFSDTLVTSVTFKVDIEPQTNASISLPSGIVDIDGRPLQNSQEQFHLRIGSPREELRPPQRISFFEKTVPNLALPVAVVNLHQQIDIIKAGNDSKKWLPVTDMSKIIRMILAYNLRGDERETEEYLSPMASLGVPYNQQQVVLEGEENRATYLRFPFSTEGQPQSGLYALEISSPTLSEGSLDFGQEDQKIYQNPEYVLAQVTDLSVTVKKGLKESRIWVTRLSTGTPVANAQFEIRNCLGDVVVSGKTDAQGVGEFDSRPEWADSCQINGQDGPTWGYFSKREFFVSARTNDDFTFTHSSWEARDSYAFSAPGVGYFYNSLTENEPYFHAVIGVNLVKPGQEIPVQIMAKVPTLTGFEDVPRQDLPATARIFNYENENLYYEFPLTWNNGAAEFTWQVPAQGSAKIGGYMIQLDYGQGRKVWVDGADIEVAEFKVPLMTGSVAFSSTPFVKPETLPTNTTVLYGNGVGAKDLDVSLSYYFQPSYITFKNFEEFSFDTGKAGESKESQKTLLPTADRPALIEGLKTNKEGSLTVDLAKEPLKNDETVGAVLKKINRTQNLIVRARYQDQMGEYQTLSTSEKVYTAPSYIGVNLVEGSRETARIQAVDIDVNGKVSTQISQLNLNLYRVKTTVIGEELYGGFIKNTVEREYLAANWKGPCALEKGVLSCGVGTLKAGTYAFQFTSKSQADKAGHLIFKIDAEGRVYGDHSYYDFGDEMQSKNMTLALNKESYKAGETAVVSFSAPFKNCQALVTLER